MSALHLVIIVVLTAAFGGSLFIRDPFHQQTVWILLFGFVAVGLLPLAAAGLP